MVHLCKEPALSSVKEACLSVKVSGKVSEKVSVKVSVKEPSLAETAFARAGL